MGRDAGGIWFQSRFRKLIPRWSWCNTCVTHSLCDTGGIRKDSDEDFVGSMDDSSKSSDVLEFVPESQMMRGFFLPAPASIPDLSSVCSHFHTLHLYDMEEELRERFGDGGEDYDVDGGPEFRVGHRFSTREVVHMGVKNYNIRRASEKWWSLIRNTFAGASNMIQDAHVRLYPWVLLTNREVRRYGGLHDCLAPAMSSDHAELDGRLICNFILPIIKSNPSVCISVLQSALQQSYLVRRGLVRAAGGGVDPYLNFLGIHNSRGPRSQQNSSKSRVTRKNSPGRSINGIEINSVPPIRCPQGSAAKIIRTFHPIVESLWSPLTTYGNHNCGI
ncbi:hypothetical protein PIB30_070912 [Stylosanthes scabra]|uniref:Uncharacterized protein n=1 Tax=Stylosanthes scabra TaxID=79078 RepID=A0ABU6VM76_9FABA|nr:hypothetical protein [Stylosanthes scabra]